MAIIKNEIPILEFDTEQTVKNGQKPAEKQHRPPERQSVRNRLRQLQEESKQSSQSKQRKKSQGRDR